MLNKGNRKTKKIFNESLLEAINESLTILIDASAMKSFLSYIQKNHKIRGEEIGQNLDILSSELKKFFGVNSVKIEKLVVALLYSKLGLEYEENESFNLEDYVKNANARILDDDEFLGSQLPLSDKEISVIHALGEDARKSVTQIAKDTKLSRPTVTSMIEKLIERNILQIRAGLNIRELKFPTAFLAMEYKLPDGKKELVRNISTCPRVLMVLEPLEKANILVLLYGEDQATLKSTIESFRNFSGVNILDIYHSEPPLVPSTFNIPIFTEKGEVTPCGQKCSECSKYTNGDCLGCPAVKAYKGSLKSSS